jgi:hypothetical protein
MSIKLCVLLLASCFPSFLIAQDGSSTQDSLTGERRFRFKAGLGTQQALHVGAEWHIPLAQGRRHVFATEASFGVRLFDPVFVAGVGFNWLMIGRNEKRGGMIGLTLSLENAGDENDLRSRRIITLHPGVLFRAGQGLLTITAGAGPSFNHHDRVEGNERLITDVTDIFDNIDVSLTYDLRDLFD